MKTSSAAVITVFKANKMTKKGRREVAKWMRRQADFLEKEGYVFSARFTARYLYPNPEEMNAS
jgi:hypothetical protein